MMVINYAHLCAGGASGTIAEGYMGKWFQPDIFSDLEPHPDGITHRFCRQIGNLVVLIAERRNPWKSLYDSEKLGAELPFGGGVEQVPVLFDGTVRENPAYPFSFKRNQNLKRPDFLTTLDSVGLSQALLERDASKLSVGEQQRVAIARALCLSPEILLLDEPTAPLDHESAEVVEETIMHLNHDMELTIVMVTHDTDQASRLGDEALRIVNGRVDGNME